MAGCHHGDPGQIGEHAVTREQVYMFVHGCVERGKPECAAAAVICFEWLQRPENVVAGHITEPGPSRPSGSNTTRPVP